jgi:hypothetical protein
MRITCPICKTVTTWEENSYRPFCSERCKLHDLGNWASEKYGIEGDETVSEDLSSENEDA